MSTDMPDIDSIRNRGDGRYDEQIAGMDSLFSQLLAMKVTGDSVDNIRYAIRLFERLFEQRNESTTGTVNIDAATLLRHCNTLLSALDTAREEGRRDCETLLQNIADGQFDMEDFDDEDALRTIHALTRTGIVEMSIRYGAKKTLEALRSLSPNTKEKDSDG